MKLTNQVLNSNATLIHLSLPMYQRRVESVAKKAHTYPLQSSDPEDPDPDQIRLQWQ
jgi:hypothetical protein